ncbi:helix-turn-helix transcriptional regulator [Goodfellowiella coeruleoviolacea]|uniref:DNA-binding response regulator, NarL/FixJ family, contains REC and HTH domains n=1 Tax=Goodfellowiella coeruleoviolacea TaxID=334858 RepID=A0AAE3G8M5_9PSEU|nr:response regulator transcription factor [Goodfellowiella coeruleoviolacea]MCP2163585.1 DNA-binding response regulator, NarL/FixJ family, contains REC and HTH domains [Goodfellowiella coeruleoviolacea]
MERVRVAVKASDPLSQAGITSYLTSRPEVLVVTGQPADADVVVFAADRIIPAVAALLRRIAGETGLPIVLVTGELDESELLGIAECRVAVALPRIAATGDRLVDAVWAAASGGSGKPAELARRFERVRREVLGRHRPVASDLAPREINVLRLMAEGWDTAEIADKLCYSERTVKNVIYAMTNRLNLRNRPHAVAYALRAGVI